MLVVTSLSRSYGDFKAVNQASFTIARGEVVGLLGHNGAGKTTIMKMLSGYLEPDIGSIVVDGVDLSADPATIQRGLGYLPESLPLYPELSVVDYLDYAAELKGLEGEAKANELRRVVRETDLKDKLLAPISTLSRGYRQRVGVAQAILGQPRLLILDEPTNGLDPAQTDQMRQLIRKISLDATVILSTHIMQEVEAVCDRVLILRRGDLVVDAKLADLRQSKQLLLDTSLVLEADALAEVDGVCEWERVEPERYRVKLADDADPRRVGAALARVVAGAKAELYQLQVEQRDLETLFRQVNQGVERAA
ncbi:MAG: ABC transporter ATP-binding protein [Vulcanimicrobiota bacterium]